MRILFVSPRQCWPVLSGAKLREYHLAKALGRHASLTYLFFAESGQPLPASTDLPFCKEILPVPAPPRYTAARLVRGLLGRWPLPVENYTSAAMKAAISEILRHHDFDFIHFDNAHMAAYVGWLAGMRVRSRVVFDWHNIESEGMRRFAASTRSRFKRFYAAITARRLAAVEQMLLRCTFGTVVCSERERVKLLSIAPRNSRIAVIENGVDAAYFDQSAGASAVRDRVLFVGAMNYYPNVDAIVPFAHQIWPRIRRRYPHWRLTVVGASPPPAVLALRGQPGVEVAGTVPDVRPYYHEAFAAVVPLRTGMGTRLKILEGMAAGVPVVSSTIGAEGLAVTPGKDILIADREQDWLQALGSLTDNTLRTALVESGRSTVSGRYDWKILGDALCRLYEQWLRE
jgi:sugar transferase (PEP-CTERM/EpsH1 system associated)